LATREQVIRSCETLFRELLAPRCSPNLSHCDWHRAAPLNSICYMWWDIMPVYGGPKLDDQRALQNAALDTMGVILRLESIACQESALHGLGHWHAVFPEQTKALIDRFLQARPEIPSKLRLYAQSARYGCVL
jgi:hypothetical protein